MGIHARGARGAPRPTPLLDRRSRSVPPAPTRGEARPIRKTAARAGAGDGAGVLTEAQLAKLTAALEAARDGDFSVRLRADGALADVAEAFNTLVERNQQVTKELVRVIAAVTTAVANGDLSKKITVDVKGEVLDLKETINTMVDQLRSFSAEVTRVAKEVGTEGKLGGQAQVEGVS